MNATIVLASSSDQLEAEIRASFDPPLNGEFRRLSIGTSVEQFPHPNVVADVLSGDPAVVAIGPDCPADAALALSAAVTETRPEVAVVLIATLTPLMWERALAAGVRGVVAPDADADEMRATLDRARDLALRTRANVIGAAAAPTSGRLLCVLSPKGGSGKTMLATNLAVVLSAAVPGGVALVDLDVQFGDIATALQLMPEHTVSALNGNAKTPDTTAVKILMTRYSPLMHVLCAPSSPVDAEDVVCERVGEALDVLVNEFPFTVVDTGAGLDEYALAAVERATDLVLVCSTDVGSVRALRKELDVLDRLGMNAARRRVVLNRADARVGLTAQDIEATLGLRVDASIPSSRSVPLTMNRGVPVVEAEPRSQVARSIGTIAGHFASSAASLERQPAERTRRWGKQS